MILAIDLGASKIRIAQISGTKVKNKKVIRNPGRKDRIKKNLFDLINQYPKQKICVSFAGVVIDGLTKGTLNMDFENVPLAKLLKQKFKTSVFIDNDANCAGLAELHYGVGKKYNNFVFLTLGTGIGGAIIINKKLYRGNGSAGEVGSMHMGKNIYEYLASGSAQTRIASAHGLGKISPKELELQADKGNKKALDVFNTIGENLGTGLANLAYLLDPDVFIFGGGFAKVKHFYPKTRENLKKLYPLNQNLKIIKAKFGDNAGLIGAALLAK